MNPTLFKEKVSSQAQAVKMFVNMGYEYLSVSETTKLRRQDYNSAILTDILEKQLKKLNKFDFDGEEYEISNNNISELIGDLQNPEGDKGLIETNKAIYRTLISGRSVREFIKSEEFNPQVKFIDFRNTENNVYHVTTEFAMNTADGSTRKKLDVVAFVNGVPLVAIECKAPDVSVEDGVRDIRAYERNDLLEHFFYYTQINIACNSEKLNYGTTGTGSKFWTLWREQEVEDEEISSIYNKPMNDEILKQILGSFYNEAAESVNSKLTLSDQARSIYALCNKKRLLELVKGFIVFDDGVKKLARYQQYFAVKRTIDRVKSKKNDGNRRGGVIWHTQGSGKSLTMVMIAKALAQDLDISNPRIVIVTDRIHLDDQIWKTFKNTKEIKEPVKAKSGKKLLEFLENDKYEIITTVNAKFETLLHKKKAINSENIFVLVDESHRSQYGLTYNVMKDTLPKATYIGFTGTPLTKREKNTLEKFGEFIHKYTIKEAEKDEVILPLLYENRHVKTNLLGEQLNREFSRVAEPLTKEQQADLKRKQSRESEITGVEKILREIAYDISDTYLTHWKDTKFKAQVAVNRKREAILMKKLIDEASHGKIRAEVVISDIDDKEVPEDEEYESRAIEENFWKEIKKRYGTAEKYDESIQNSFKHEPEGVEIIICVSKLLTGFDAPVNTVLFNYKKLKEHNLLQAIARVNRIEDGKDFGIIIDYMGILEELNDALSHYEALAGYDPQDIEGAITSIDKEAEKLPELLRDLESIFSEIDNKDDVYAYTELLNNKDLRNEFYDRLSIFSRTLHTVLNSAKFRKEKPDKVKEYLDTLYFYNKLKRTIQVIYDETIDFRDYEEKVRKLLDSYVYVEGMEQITEGQVNISDDEEVEKEIERLGGNTAAKAAAKAHRLSKNCEENFDKDPAFYKKFSDLIEETIQDFRRKKIDSLQYLDRIKKIHQEINKKADEGIPKSIKEHERAKLFFRNLKENLKEQKNKFNDDNLAELSVKIHDMFDSKSIVDWKMNDDIKNEMRNQLDDILFTARDENKLDIEIEEIDMLLDKIMKLGENNY